MQQLTSSTAPSAAPSVRIENLDLETLAQLQQEQSQAVYGGIASAPIASAPIASAPVAPAVPTFSSVQPTERPKVANAPLSAPLANWSPALQTLLDQPPSSLPRHLIMGGLTFGLVLGVWAWFGQVQDVSRAPGRLVPQGELYKVQPVSQGEVAKLRVVEGQTVKAGQVIAELDNRLATSELERLNQSLVAAELELFQTEELIERTQLEAKTERQIAAATMQAQQAAIEQAQSQSDSIQALMPQLQTEKLAYTARLGRLQPLVSEGAIAEDRLFEIEQTLRQQQKTITQHQGELAQAQSEGKRLQAELREKQAAAQKGELEAQQQLQQLKMQAAAVKAKIAEIKPQIAAARAKMEDLFLYAPVAGTITSLKVRNPGEVAQPGQTLAEIAPAGMPLVLSALLPTQEAGLVQKGMPVQIKFDAFPYQNYGLVSGKVISISPDSEPNERLGAVYQVKIGLDHRFVGEQQIELQAGQTGRAEIVVRKHRLIDVLLEPIRKLQKGGIDL